METIRIEKKENPASLHKIEFDSEDNYIIISSSDPTLFDRFVNGFQSILELSEDTEKKVADIDLNTENDSTEDTINKTIAASRINVDFSNKAMEITENIFGKGVIHKYYRDIYKEIPEFLPDVDCFLDFYEKLVPAMENIFSSKIKEREIRRKKRMQKFIPQDYKKPGTH